MLRSLCTYILALTSVGTTVVIAGEAVEAAEVEKRFKKAWVWADVTLPGSRF